MRLYPLRSYFVCVFLFLVLLFESSGCASTPGGALPTPLPQRQAAIPLEPCQLAAPEGTMRLAARCGRLTVPENRSAPGSRFIDLRVAVIPALSRTPASDPFVFLTGGPGEAATQDFVLVSPAFQAINAKRDIVMVDQRGTGQSHALLCPAAPADATDEAAIRAWVETCLEQLNADPRYYTTLDAVADLDQVRAVLGYERVNLYGVSYGTRVAQTYLAMYPDRVRTVILDGVVSPAQPLGLSVGTDAERALGAIFSRCAADPTCHTAFPDPESDLQALMEQLGESPATVRIPHPTTGRVTEVQLTRAGLGDAIRLLLYAPESAALIPYLLHSARSSGDLSALAAESQIVSRQVEGSISIGVNNSVVCSEDVPYYAQFAPLAEKEKATLFGAQYHQLETICKYWPSRPPPAGFRTPVKSTAPVLLLSGEADPVTPPSNAEQVAATLSSSLAIVAPGQGHSIIRRGCVSRLAAAFVEQGNIDGLNATCVQSIKPMPFFLSANGSAP